MKKTSAPSGITLEGDYNLLGTKILSKGTDRTSYARYTDDPQIGVDPAIEKKKKQEQAQE
ncbi:hypothetical protein ABEW34_26085 [Paenibacillus algorifonticola]|uniref:hypothetical protein n=1 Tax=Paenibacillus algorifonticola TaxID=684063 RepID=UPI003D2814E8